MKTPIILRESSPDTLADVAPGVTFYLAPQHFAQYLQSDSLSSCSAFLMLEQSPAESRTVVHLESGRLVKLPPSAPVAIVELYSDTTDEDW